VSAPATAGTNAATGPAVISMGQAQPGNAAPATPKTLEELIAEAARNASNPNAPRPAGLPEAAPTLDLAAGQQQAPVVSPPPSNVPPIGPVGPVGPGSDLGTPRTTPPAVRPASPATAGDLGAGSAAIAEVVKTAGQAWQAGKLVEARNQLNAALIQRELSPTDQGVLRSQIATLNESIIFSPTIYAGDTITDTHVIAKGESLGRIVRRQGLPIDWRLLARINRLSSPEAIRVGQKLKVVRLPFHAVVDKSNYRMDVYAGPPETGTSAGSGGDAIPSNWIFVRSFRVGLGEKDGTPTGRFVVRPNSKLVNPKWVNPRTGEVFAADDPKNPIGEHWLGLDGTDERTKAFAGYGIHGTIEPESVGQQRSMGCVRLNAADIELVYELLTERLSTVRIAE
jgi:lipoprotein-anchoring transpeptidase ErfK/SrfK